MSDNGIPTDKKRHNKPQAYLVFAESRRNGFSITASGKAAGVSRPTATRYETLRIADVERENRLLEARGKIASRNQLAEDLTETLREAEPQYKAQIASTLSRIMGYDAPTRSQIEVRSVPASVESWMQSCLTIDVTPEQPAITESNQPKALPDKALPD